MTTHSTNYLSENLIEDNSQDQRQWQDEQITQSANSDFDEEWVENEVQGEIERNCLSYWEGW